MAELEHALDIASNEQTVGDSPEETEGKAVINGVAEDGAICVGQKLAVVTPSLERASLGRVDEPVGRADLADPRVPSKGDPAFANPQFVERAVLDRGGRADHGDLAAWRGQEQQRFDRSMEVPQILDRARQNGLTHDLWHFPF